MDCFYVFYICFRSEPRSEPQSGFSKWELYKACEGKEVEKPGGSYEKRANITKVKQILNKVKPEELLHLLMCYNTDSWGRNKTALDSCLANNWNKDQDCIATIVRHIIDKSPDPDLLSLVFPYTGCVTSTNLMLIIIQMIPSDVSKLLHATTVNTGQTALDLCLEQGNGEYICSITEYIIENSSDLIFQVFPYTGCVKSTNLAQKILEMMSGDLDKLLNAKTVSCELTTLDLFLKEENTEYICNIAEHIIEKSSDPDLLSIVFPYSAIVTSTNLLEKLLDTCPHHTNKLLQAVTNKDKMNVLHVGCRYGNSTVPGIIKQSLVKKDTMYENDSGKNMDNRTPRDVKLMKDLLMKQDAYNRIGLQWACENGHIHVVRVFLALLEEIFNKQDIEKVLLMQDFHKEPVLHIATMLGHSDIATALLATLQLCDKQAIENVLLMKDDTGMTVLHWACWKGSTEILAALLDALESCDKKALQKALLMGRADGSLPHELIFHGYRVCVEGLSVLLGALGRCDKDVIESVLTKGDNREDTALHHACREEDNEMGLAVIHLMEACDKRVIEKMLLKQDHNYGLADTALHLAVERGHNEQVIIMLHLAESCNKEILENLLLIEDAHSRRTALHRACMRGDIKIVTTLLHACQTCDKRVIHDVMLKQDREPHEGGRTVLHCAINKGSTEVVLALLNTLEQCDKEVILNALLKQDNSGKTTLHSVCEAGQTEMGIALLHTLQCSNPEDFMQVLLVQDKWHKHTAMDLAVASKNGILIILISLLAARDKNAYTKLKLFSHTREKSDRNPFSEIDSSAWQFVLSHIPNKINSIENEISGLDKTIKQTWRGDKKLEALLKAKKENLMTYTKSLKYLPLVAAEKNKLGESLYDYDNLTHPLTELLDICQRYNMDCFTTLSDMFPSFSLSVRKERCERKASILENENHRKGVKGQEDKGEQKRQKVKTNIENQDNSKRGNMESTEDSRKRLEKKNQGNLLPYSKAAPIHPLTVIADSGNLAIIKHPYIRADVDECWSIFGRYIFGINLILYILFLFFLITFFTTHQVQSDDESLKFSSRLFWLSEISRYGAIVLSLCGFIFECVQLSTKRQHYFNIYNQFENYIDLLLFLCTPAALILPLVINYNEHIHWAGSVLIVLAGIRAAWMFTHVNIWDIGHGFRMLFSVLWKVVKFSPILLFFILIFSIVFHNLLQNQEPFSHVGISIMKIMAMSIGELDFTDSFFDESNVHTFEIVSILMFVLFLAIMTISMMNLLIGIAVGDVAQLYRQGEQAAFQSKVDLILQYSYMMPSLSRKVHAMSLNEIHKWGKRQDIGELQRKFELGDHTSTLKEKIEERKEHNLLIFSKFQLEYVSRMEKEHAAYRVTPDAISAVQEKVEKTSKQSDLEDLKKQVQMQNEKIEKLNEQMDQLITHLIPERKK